MGNRLSSAPKAHASAPCEATKKDAQPDSSHPGEGAWAWWAAMGHPQKVLAPMVGASERAFRMLCRRHGCDLAVTPMIHARLFGECDKLQRDVLRDLEGSAECGDRPLLAQLCGDDKDVLLACAQACAPHVDGVDLNLGCPQGIAKRGHYGAFLLEEPELVCGIVEHLTTHLSVPVTCKIRIVDKDDIGVTIELARRLCQAGASLITIHGRTKEMKGQEVGEVDWDQIQTVISSLDGVVPTLANGGVEGHADLARAMGATGASGAMTSEAALEDPTVFDGKCEDGLGLAEAYLDLCKAHPPLLKMAAGHVHKLLFRYLQAPGGEGFRARVGEAKCLAELEAVVAAVRAAGIARNAGTWYQRHRSAAAARAARAPAEPVDVLAEEDDVMGGLFGDE